MEGPLKLFKGEIISFKEGIGMSERNTKHVIKMLVAFFCDVRSLCYTHLNYMLFRFDFQIPSTL